ncbi:uncharacterized protein DSM5745_06060 [Aspergillus mulundensis]|uniref:Nephrocystin 3-like N-terminal domain-containing protein n=1 Tax=Aspergillus mulundensis TaxID=1810919 RepID=A0A3D8RYX4_9EURO|nr:hypothetical protein DSM5745_06060 [Aspergillus mulundensis]RDW79208.1 hypothetical protein DSM5745_06060 [Aspergillus mulundensis]
MADSAQYTVGWICALQTEYVAARAFLDERHPPPSTHSPNDNNHYTLGKIGDHLVVIAVLPDGEYGVAAAASIAESMLHSFPNIRFGLMVGIGGGAPTSKQDIRLGDVVVSSSRGNDHGGVSFYDLGKELQDEDFRPTGFLNQAPRVLRTALAGVQTLHEEEGHQLQENIRLALERNPRLRKKYARPNPTSDRLYQSDFVHRESERSCDELCSDDRVIIRPERGDDIDDPVIHYGLIASGSKLVRNATFRDKLAAKQGILCFEMEAAGLRNLFPCLVIRGICDYSDSHKNKQWQGYAAMTAAAYARDLLNQIIPQQVQAEQRASEILGVLQPQLDDMSELVSNVQITVSASARDLESVVQSIDLDKLPVAEGAEFGSYKEQHEAECLPGTRTDLLRRVEEWAHSPKGKCVFWLYGLAGTGKSTVSRSTASLFKKQRLLAASFFFKRNGGDRGNARRFFSTIARQLFASIPELRPALIRTIKKEPDIAVQSFNEQFTKLIYDPLSQLEPQQESSLLLIVIDALDECDNDQDIQLILHLLPRVQDIKSVSQRWSLVEFLFVNASTCRVSIKK